MTTAQQQFLELLRSGLWDRPADSSIFKETDWKNVYRIAIEQTVIAIITYGIETLPKEMLPPKEIMMKLLVARLRIEQSHNLLNSTLNQIIKALKDDGIPSVLLKGQGVAQNYWKPEGRNCGDIDLYTGIDRYNRACEIIDSLNPHNQKPGAECEHHMHLSLNGVEVEIHRQADMMPGRRHNASLQKWTKECLDANFCTDRLGRWDNNGTEIRLAPATFDAFFILHHAVRHMTVEGVGLRQVCDWTMYLHRRHNEIDTEVLQQKLKEFHMETIWKEFGILAVTILGLPKEELPLAPSSLESKKTAELLRHIFISGNFGRFDANAKDKSKTTYIKRKWRSFRFRSSRLFKLFNLFPSYAASYMWHWSTGAFIRFFQQWKED